MIQQRVEANNGTFASTMYGPANQQGELLHLSSARSRLLPIPFHASLWLPRPSRLPSARRPHRPAGWWWACRHPCQDRVSGVVLRTPYQSTGRRRAENPPHIRPLSLFIFVRTHARFSSRRESSIFSLLVWACTQHAFSGIVVDRPGPCRF